jgi:hypothetical protein
MSTTTLGQSLEAGMIHQQLVDWDNRAARHNWRICQKDYVNRQFLVYQEDMRRLSSGNLITEYHEGESKDRLVIFAYANGNERGIFDMETVEVFVRHPSKRLRPS